MKIKNGSVILKKKSNNSETPKKKSKWTEPLVFATILSIIVLGGIPLFIFLYPILSSEPDKLEASLILFQTRIMRGDKDTAVVTLSIHNGGTQPGVLTYMQPMLFAGENFPYGGGNIRYPVDIPTFPLTIKYSDTQIIKLKYISQVDDFYGLSYPDRSTTNPNKNRYCYLGLVWTSIDSKGREYANNIRLFRLHIGVADKDWRRSDSTEIYSAEPMTDAPFNLYTNWVLH